MKKNVYFNTLKKMLTTAWNEATFRGYLFAIGVAAFAVLECVLTLGFSFVIYNKWINHMFDKYGFDYDENEEDFYNYIEMYTAIICG